MAEMSKLDDPIDLRCGITIPNRIALAPLTNTQSNLDGTLHEDEFLWLMKRAGNFGLVSTCAAFVSDEGRAWDGQLGIANDNHLSGLTKLAGAINETGSISMIQLHHAGSKILLDKQRISVVAGKNFRGATIDDIERITNDFINAAKRAEKAGFGGVEIHGANGYLFTQFLSPLDNTRTDEYGGDLTSRARFLRETVQKVRNAVSPGFMVNVRISPVDTWDRRGLILKDGVQLSKWLAEDGVDIIHLSLRDASGPGPFEDNRIPVVKAIRDEVSKDVKIASAGGIWNRNHSLKAEYEGADIVALGKSSIVHPDWPAFSLQKNFTPISPPWNPDYLNQVAVSPKFIKYLQRLPGLVVGGTPLRNQNN